MGGTISKVQSAIEVRREHKDAINCMTISQDNSLLVTGSEDRTIRMWSAVTDATDCLGVLKGHTSYVTCLDICDTFIISGSADKTLRKWSMTTCECIFVFEGHTDRIMKIVCTGDFFFSSSADKTVRAWCFEAEDLDDINKEMRQKQASKGNFEPLKPCIKVFEGHTKGVYPLVFIPGGDVPFQKRNLKSTKILKINPADLMISGSADHTARSWSFDTGKNIKIFKGHTGPIVCMATDPTGKTLFTGSQDATVRSWNISKGERLLVMEGHEDSVICVLIVNRIMYTGSADRRARSWVTEFGDCTRIFKGHDHSVVVVKFYKGILFTGSGDGYARAFDSKTGVRLAEFRGHEAAITSLAIVKDKLYTGSLDSTLRIWNIRQLLPSSDEILSQSQSLRMVNLENQRSQKVDQLNQSLDDIYPEEQISNHFNISAPNSTTLSAISRNSSPITKSSQDQY